MNTGKVKFFNESKGFGFIIDDESSILCMSLDLLTKSEKTMMYPSTLKKEEKV